MNELSKADLLWLLRFINNYEALVEEYPELFRVNDIDDVKVARSIIEENLKCES